MKLEYLPDGSPDCPLIRFYEFEIPDVIELKEIFDSLANGTKLELALHRQTKIEFINCCQLNLRVGPRDRGIHK